MTTIVGAYAASPAHRSWSPSIEEEFLTALSEVDDVDGLELPWIDGLHPHDDAWLLRTFPRSLTAVLTSIPGTASRARADPYYGLASADPAGRRRALDEAKRMRDGVHTFHDAIGRRTVIGVELHSAPAENRGSAAALARSLDEIGSWDWDGASLLVEHCDAPVTTHRPEKGFLTLADELDALTTTSAPVGLSINWARSAIELRNPDAVAAQIAHAAATGHLRALVFSGVSDTPTPLGGAWQDAHLPMAASAEFPLGEPASLLSWCRAADALQAAGPLDWIGVKYSIPRADASIADRVALLTSAVRSIKALRATTPVPVPVPVPTR